MHVVTQQILKAYLDAGGAKMDESHYQRYKYALLLDWVDREQLYEVMNYQTQSGQWMTQTVEKPALLHCKHPDCEFTTTDMPGAIDHLVTHFPEMFVGGSKRHASPTS